MEDWLRPDQEDELWCIEEKESGKAVGSVGLHSDGRRSGVPGCKMLGYVLAHFCWGQGYMTEAVAPVIDYAFREEKLRLLTVNHFSFNQRSRRVIEKSGFQYEGTLRQGAVLYDGRAADLCCYSLLPGSTALGRPKSRASPCGSPRTCPRGKCPASKPPGREPQPRCRLPAGKPYDQWLGEKITARTQPPQGLVPSTLYYLVDREGHVAGPWTCAIFSTRACWSLAATSATACPPNTGDGAGRP